MSDAAQVQTPLLPNAGQIAEKGITSRVGSGEDLITLAEAARCLPKIDGQKVAISTIFRWCSTGLRGARLQHIRLGKKICTTRGALLRFFSHLTDLDDHRLPDTNFQRRILKRRPINSKQRLRALAEADAVLQRARI